MKVSIGTKDLLDGLDLGCIGECDGCPVKVSQCILDHSLAVEKVLNEMKELIEYYEERERNSP